MHGYLNGQAGASATLDILNGKVNPSGRLAETYPITYEQTPAFRYYLSNEKTSEYRESVYAGYRYYDTSKVRVQYPFGFGLFYTEFTYSDLIIEEDGINVSVTNTGDRDGAEVVHMWLKVSMNLFGVKFTRSLLKYNVLRDATGNILIGGGLGYFISYELGSFLAQCINFPLQRNITFKSHGNPVYQAIWYFVAWVVISLICNGFNNLWMPVASAYVAPAVYNMLVTIITGGVSMVIFFFVFKIIFPEGKAE